MRLHTLELTAVGPFPGTHTIDFSTLSASGLFLLEGPTGAGKSTIIDAIVFALYGEPASSSSSRDRIASRHAKPGTTPAVELVFETSAGVYRTRRSPEHMRPKQRGLGLTKEHAQVRLWRLSSPDDEGGQPLSNRVGEADAEILRVVGLSREQFVQTVVLPQGEFATFLRAAPEERRAVLQRLFGTEIFQRMQDRLVDAARAARREAETADAEARAAISSFVRIAGRDETVEGDAEEAADVRAVNTPPPTRSALLARLAEAGVSTVDPEAGVLAQEVARDLSATVAGLEQAEEDAARCELEARLAFDAARRLAANVAIRLNLLAEKSEHESRREEFAALEESLAAAQRAVAVVPAVSAAADAETAARHAMATWQELAADVAQGPDVDLVAPGSDLARARSRAEHEVGSLTGPLALERAMPARRAEIDAMRTAVEDREGAYREAQQQLAARPDERIGLEAALAVHRAHAAEAVVAELRLARAQDVRTAALEAKALDPDVARARRRLAQRAAEAQLAVDRLAGLRRRRITDISGELARGLRSGDPCPVCGSAEHPAPAPRSDDAVTSSDVERAEQECSSAESALTAARDACTDLEARLRVAQAAALGRSAEAAEAELTSLQRELAVARAEQEAAQEADNTLRDFDRLTEDLRVSCAELQDGLVVDRERLRSAEHRLALDNQILANACADHPTVASRANRLNVRISDATRLETAERCVAEARQRTREQDQVLSAALAAASFARAEDALSAALSPNETREIAFELERYRTAGSRIAAGLAEPGVAGLTGAESPEVEAFEEQLTAASQAHVRATRAAERARAVSAAVREAADLVTNSLAVHAAAMCAAQPVSRMAELAAAGEANDRRHTLATFVLLRRFEEVLAAANLRLATMSNGRYQLARTDEREGGVTARRTGLAVVVEDLVVGDRRAPRTLSGGETFYVSLCLALGLADVVRAEAGGIDLGTLFIDEGFGSLDAQTLDTVMRELGRLRSGGRVVGVVSHVAELKRQVAERIEVRRRPDGTSTLAVVA